MSDLAGSDSLLAAGFHVAPIRQERFVTSVMRRIHSRLEMLAHPWVTGVAGGALSVGFSALSMSRGDALGAMAAGAAALSHLAVAFIGFNGQRTRSSRDAEPGAGCYRDDDGELRFTLDEGETLIAQHHADGRVRAIPRRVGAFFQSMWGLLLGGLPLALAAGRELVGLPLGAVAIGTFIGTWVFGRGVAHFVGVRPVESVVLTDRRVVLLLAPGMVHITPLVSLPYRPVVVARDDHRATLAIGQRSLPAVRPAPLFGLVGWDDLDVKDAERWAGELMDARKKRMKEAGRS